MTIARRSGLGLIAPPDDVAAITDHLVNLWDAKATGGSIVAAERSYVNRFSEENMGEQLCRLLDAMRR